MKHRERQETGNKKTAKEMEEREMAFLEAHWHCLLPLIGIAAYLLGTGRRERGFSGSEPRGDSEEGD
jgi:hypothetical protein